MRLFFKMMFSGTCASFLLASCAESADQPRPSDLGNSSSLYLRHHAGDLVKWDKWQPQTFKKAALQNKPILLSIGFSACHWCHVMQQQSFRDTATAKYMNDHFVNILVDREERPDVDAAYTDSLEALSGRVGWPMTLFLKSDGSAFFGGSYFPPGDERQEGSFRHVLREVYELWSRDRECVDEKAKKVRTKMDLGKKGELLATQRQLSADNLNFALGRLMDRTDEKYGGLAQSRKYPIPAVLSLAISLKEGNGNIVQNKIRNRCHKFYATTLDAMALGQICDRVDGGFFRYATNEQWKRPHFEKMLNDNASIAMVYFRAAAIDKNAFWSSTALDTVDFMVDYLLLPDGTFAGSLDADTSTGEGAFYTFTFVDTLAHLPVLWRDKFLTLTNFSPRGNCFENENLPYYSSVQSFIANARIINQGLIALKHIRTAREKPGRIANASVAWNGLAISALVKAHQFTMSLTAEKRVKNGYLSLAQRAAQSVITKCSVAGGLSHAGQENQFGFLDDYAFFESALLDLYEVDGNKFWLEHALRLDEIVQKQYFDPVSNSFLYRPRASLSGRAYDSANAPAATTDGANLSSAAAATHNLIRLAGWPLKRLEGQSSMRLKQAREVLQTNGRAMQADPVKHASMLASLKDLLETAH